MTTRKRGKGKTKHAQELQISGLKFTPAKLKEDGTRKTKAKTTLSLLTTEEEDPRDLLDFLATVQERQLTTSIAPDDSAEWTGVARITCSTISPPKVGKYSGVSLAIEVESDDPETHLDLFRCRLSMDGRDAWEAEVSFEVLQQDFTLEGVGG